MSLLLLLGAPVVSGTWVGSAGSVTATATSGSFEQLWYRSPAAIAVTATPGSFSAAGSVTWDGSASEIEFVGEAGAFYFDVTEQQGVGSSRISDFQRLTSTVVSTCPARTRTDGGINAVTRIAD